MGSWGKFTGLWVDCGLTNGRVTGDAWAHGWAHALVGCTYGRMGGFMRSQSEPNSVCTICGCGRSAHGACIRDGRDGRGRTTAKHPASSSANACSTTCTPPQTPTPHITALSTHPHKGTVLVSKSVKKCVGIVGA
eukprot:469768-Prorocentrum_minimum.AAC.3